ncbi:MAG: ATP-binding protein [Bacteroidales bacterium]|nr:ATP-binding protein [Bacteroidales bacterium]MDZ4204725.1 ATP-binding protein [Bacteroidales bacterium]
MEKSIIKKIILENQQRIPGIQIVKRDYATEPHANYIFTGQRRAGKTFFVFSLIQGMLEQGIGIESVLYVNFEDERLIGLDVSGLDMILESYREMFSHTPVLVFDEIQNIAGWQKFARRLADSGYRTYITGSNSEMLSSEMASTLGGRFMVLEIESLSFREFLLFHGIHLVNNMEFSPARFKVMRLFERYVAEGGFPELIRFSDKKEYLSNIFQKVFLGDIIARYQIRNPFALRMLIKKLAESTMDEVSYNRMRNIIASTGLQVGTATVIEYVKHLEDAFLISPLNNYSAKISSRESKKKYYFRDNGLLSLFLIEPEAFQLETLVFNKLRKMYGDHLFYLRNGFEVDFYLPGEALIQVCYRFREFETRKREIAALARAYEKNPAKCLTIVTFNDEETINEGNVTIEVVPAWKWILRHSVQQV